jgi:predicted esterase
MRKMVFACFIPFLIVQLVFAQEAKELRAWTARKGGKTVQARFVAYENGAILLVLPNRRTTKIAMTAVSDADQQYVVSQFGSLRTWTDKAGGKVEGHLVKVTVDKVSLLTSALRPVTVKFSELSSDDQEYSRKEFPLPLEEQILGKWEGVTYGSAYLSQHRIEIKKVGGRLKAYDMISRGLTDDQVAQAEKRRLKPLPGDRQFYFALHQEYDVTVKGDTITLVGKKVNYRASALPASDAEWRPDTYVGQFKGPDLMVGKTSDENDSAGRFFFTRTGGTYDHSEPTDLARGKTHSLTCKYDSRCHFKLYIPKSYDPSKPAPLLVNDSPGKNAQPLSPKMAEEEGWIMIGLTESGNKVDWELCQANCHAAIMDVRRMLNIDPDRYYFSGFSGGSRRCALRGICYTRHCAGLICVGAGYGYFSSGAMSGHYQKPPTHLPIFFIVGKTDMNHSEVTDRIIPSAKKRNRNHELIVHPGGHSWGRAEDHEAAIRWLAKQVR